MDVNYRRRHFYMGGGGAEDIGLRSPPRFNVGVAAPLPPWDRRL